MACLRTERLCSGVFTDQKHKADVVVSYSQTQVTVEQLPALLGILQQELPKLKPGLEIVSTRSANINGQAWVSLECNSAVPGEKVQNDMYVTSMNGRMLTMSFVCYNDSAKCAPSELSSVRSTVHVIMQSKRPL